jgi:hypothetical protein
VSVGFVMQTGRWADTDDVVLFPLGAHASGASLPVELGDRSVLRLTLGVTSAGADAQLAMRLETAETRDGPWRPAGEFSKHTSPARERAAFGGLDRWVRAVAEITGAVTFGLAGEAA